MLMPSWGHTGSYICLVLQLLQKDPTLVVTVVQHKVLVPRMEAQLKTCEYDTNRLRLIGVGMKESPWVDVVKELIDCWKSTVLHELVVGSEEWPKPRSIHLDMLSGGFVLEDTRRILGPDCKILNWFSMALASLSCVVYDWDFPAIAQEIFSDEGRRQGRSMDEILEHVALAFNGTDRLSGLVIKFPGRPDMYDYERFAEGAGQEPARALADKSVAQQWIHGKKLVEGVDGFIVPTSTCVESVGVPYWREFFKTRGQELFTVGPMALTWMDAPPTAPTSLTLHSFLETALCHHGPKSVLYISFGSLAFPIATPELVAALVETLLDLETPFPFIFALGCKIAYLPTDLIQRVNASGKGLICHFWVEQRAILQHPALGWFLTHGGYNSITEGLCQGLPLIVWPVFAEQPFNAACLSLGPKPVAIELMQTRTGPQRAPALRGGPSITGTVKDASAEFRATFDDARGEKGAVLRENAENLARDLRDARSGEVEEALVGLAKF